MTDKDLRTVIAANLKYFMGREGSPYRNANALATAAKVAPNTVRNLLDPKKRTVTAEKPEGYPTLDKLEAIAGILGIDVWELLHPDVDTAIKAREFYAKLERDFRTPPDQKPLQRSVAPRHKVKSG